MRVPLTVNDFLQRAELVYPDRVAIVDEPDQPADDWGRIDYREMARRARAIAAGLDELGIGVGERIAMVSHNSARLLTALFGVSGSGRILVPVNFRLVAEEVSYIVEHSGARILLIDPELEEAMQDVECEMKWIIGSETDTKLMRYDIEPVAWEPDEDATATINYTSGTTARPKGVQLTHRNVWLNAAI
ncbi:MAG: AMP-binding protein, partial [Actinomycetota bacterium]|nr:AMP-binding protein [Actinomycetota bacterium]